MAEPRVTYTPRAQKDIDGIIHYLMTSYSTATAKRTYDEIIAKVQQIAEMPSAYPPHIDKALTFKRVVRWTIAKKNYKIFFTTNIDDSGILVITIKNVRSSLKIIRRAIEEE